MGTESEVNHMKCKVLFTFAVAGALCAQQSPPPPPAGIAAPTTPVTPDTVVAVSQGTKITAGEVRKILDLLPAPMRQNYTRDPKGFLNQWLLLKLLVKEAESQKLPEKSPYKEGLELARMQVLFQAAMDEYQSRIMIPKEDLQKYYETKKDGYQQAMLKLVYVPFSASPQAGSNQRTEKDALARAEEVVKKARSGADFAALVKEYSEDPISKEKAGDFGPIKKEDKVPEAVKQAVFQLKKDQVSDPVRQPNGYYVFRMVSLTPPSFDELSDPLFRELKNERLKQWMDANMKSVEVKVERPDFFQQGAAQ